MADHPVLGYVVWAVLFGALFAWEGLARKAVTLYERAIAMKAVPA